MKAGTTMVLVIEVITIYRDLRKRGITVPSTDAAIAAVAIHHGFPLFTRDEHFTEIARHSRLELLT